MLLKRTFPREDKLCFVFMPMGCKPDLNGNVYDWDLFYPELKRMIEAAGLRCQRADEVLSTETGMESIWSGIQRAQLVVADLTGINPNVMFEVALALCLWKPIVFIARKPSDIPFDLRAYRALIYEDSMVGAKKLADSLSSLIKEVVKSPALEAHILPYPQDVREPSEVVDGTVTSVEPECAGIKLEDGRRLYLFAEDFSWVRAKGWRNLADGLAVGDKVKGCVVYRKDQWRFSLRHAQRNPWEEFSMRHPVGCQCSGLVLSVETYGVFVQIERDFSGLLGARRLPDAVKLAKGDAVDVRIVHIAPEEREIELDFIGVRQPVTAWTPPDEGTEIEATVERVLPRSPNRGVIVRLDADNTGFVNEANLAPELRSILDDGMQPGMSIPVRVKHLNYATRRIYLEQVSA